MKKKKKNLRTKIQTKAQAKASERNWNKGVIKGMIAHINRMKGSDSLTFKERVHLSQCKIKLERLMKDWKPMI